LVEGEDDDTLVQFDYDSLGNRTAELQRVTTLQGSFTFRVGSSFDGVGNKTGINYPGLTAGTYVGPAAQPLTQTFDALDRLESIRDNLATPIATYKHVGMGARRTERTFRSTATLSCLYDENRRITDYMHTMRNSGSLRFHYTWDRESNRRVEIETRSYSTGTAQEQSYIGRSYEYDSIYRLKNDQRNVPGAQLQSVPSNAVSVLPITGTNLATYDLDRANNRRSVQIDGISQAYFSDAADPLRDKSVNQYSRVGGIAMSHDRAGNQLSGAELADQRFFDCNDQLVQLVNTVRSTDTRYRYDVLGRRLAKYSASASFPEILFVHDGAEVLEELTPGPSGTVTLLRRFVYGERIDEPLRVTSRDAADLNRNGSVSDYVDLWYHENSIGSIVALSDDNGNVVESYRYRAYGDLDEIRDRDNQLVLDANGRLDASRVKNPYTFQGRRLDFEEGSGLMHFRARYYDPKLGRFISRDPLGVWGDRSQLGNAQSAFGNNPVNVTDPTGLGWWDDINATYHIVKGVVTGDPNEVLMGAAKLAGIKNIPSAPEVRMGGGATKPPRGTEPTKEELMRPGPYAGKGTKVEPVEGRGRSFTAEQRRSVNAEGDKLGCHTCGKETSGRKSGNWTPDHQPPTTGDTAYPHCERCSAKQGGHLSKGPAPGTSKGAGPSTPKGPEKPNAPNSSGPGTPKKPGFFGRLGGTALCVFNFVGLIQMGIDYPSWKPGMGLGLIGGTDPRTGEYKSPNLHDLLGIPNEWLLDPERNLPPEEKQKRAMERFLAGGKDRT
jgi:RHS repeat-associated protein